MDQIIINADASIMRKLHILADAAKYDVACTSSGSDRRGREGMLGNSVAAGICHSFSADGRCISLLKVLMTNECAFDCKYCCNRVTNDVPRATFEPDELCKLTIEFYKRNYIEGLFLSSGVLKSPAHTMEKMVETLYLLRMKYKFNGYIHVKTIPNAPDELIAMAGYLADRISINMELPTEESLHKLCPNKTFGSIMKPMGKISGTIAAHRQAAGKPALMERARGNDYLPNSIFNSNLSNHKSSIAGSRFVQIGGYDGNGTSAGTGAGTISNIVSEKNCVLSSAGVLPSSGTLTDEGYHMTAPIGGMVLSEGENLHRPFAPAGQSTQMIIGATDETDYNLIKTTQALYQGYDLKRVFFSAYIPINDDSALPALGTTVPLLREHRLYQADWLLRYYGFQADELLSEDKPFFNEQIDPKCDWALRHLEQFPVEVETAPYDILLKVPGLGPKSAQRIVKARRFGHLNFDTLKKMGVVLKRAHYFITCGGRMLYHTPIEEKYILNCLTMTEEKENWRIAHSNESYTQMNLFDYFGQSRAQA